MKRAPLHIESLLERIGSVEKPEDLIHRYELRRELLCSKFFQGHCARQVRRSRFVTFTAPLLTGGILVVVFTFVGSSMMESVPLETLQNASEFTQVAASHEEEMNQDFIDTRAPVPVYEALKFSPVQPVNYVLMR